MDTDPDRQALDADLDPYPGPAKWCRFDQIRMHNSLFHFADPQPFGKNNAFIFEKTNLFPSS
jgi:hypothetical protein